MHFEFKRVRLFNYLVIDHILFEAREETFDDEPIFLLDDLPDGLGSEDMFVLLDHGDQSLYLFLILFSDLFIAFDLEVETLGLVDPIGAFGPC